MSHFLLALVSQFHVLHFFAFLLLLDFVSLLLFFLVLAQSFFSQFLTLLAFLLLLSLFPELTPLLAPLLFSEPLFFPALYFPFPVYVPLQKLICLSLAAQSALRAAVSASLIVLYVIFQHFLLLLSSQVSAFPLQVSVFPLFLPSQVSAFPLQVSVFPLFPSSQVSAFPLQVSVFPLFLFFLSSLFSFFFFLS